MLSSVFKIVLASTLPLSPPQRNGALKTLLSSDVPELLTSCSSHPSQGPPNAAESARMARARVVEGSSHLLTVEESSLIISPLVLISTAHPWSSAIPRMTPATARTSLLAACFNVDNTCNVKVSLSTVLLAFNKHLRATGSAIAAGKFPFDAAFANDVTKTVSLYVVALSSNVLSAHTAFASPMCMPISASKVSPAGICIDSVDCGKSSSSASA
mmetsp:Transcript_5504/g.18507  ORF Transcript_5504/g.18507 Transcript_5504/m.18507 type:complete len:214 (+) Transcript_5504:1280-1921(+)